MLPTELTRQIDADRAELLLRVDAALPWFVGHFPGQPLLPGVAQLHWVMHYGVTLLAPGKQFAAVDSIKFQQPVLPDAALRLQLNWNPQKRQLSFSYAIQRAAAEKIASSGKISLC